MLLLSTVRVLAHTVNYRVEERKAVVVKVFYAEGEEAGYSPFEVSGPGDPVPYQKGRTDRHGFLAFAPDRPGTWVVKVQGESEHGFHGVTFSVQVGQALELASFSQPLVATHLRLVVGISLLIGVTGVLALVRSRHRGSTALPAHPLSS